MHTYLLTILKLYFLTGRLLKSLPLRGVGGFLFTILALASCSSEDVKYRIAVSQCSGGLWREKQNREMQQELLLHDSITMEISCANDDATRQIHDIQHFINEKVDIIIASPGEEEALRPVIEKAYKAHIPVLLFDRDIKGNSYTAFVGGDNIAVGRQLANFAMTHLPHGGNVVELEGLMTTSPAQQRHKGFITQIAQRKDIHLIASLPAEWNGPKAARMLRQLLRTHPDIDIVVAHNDWMASTARAAITPLGTHHPSPLGTHHPTPLFVGVDGFGSIDWGLHAVEHNKIDGTVIYPTGGGTIIQTAINILNKKNCKRHTLLPPSLVTDPHEAHLLLAMNDEMEHESQTITRLLDRVVFYGHQQALEEVLLFSMIALLILAVCLVIAFWVMYITKKNSNIHLQQQQEELQQQHCQLIQITKELEDATNAKLVFFTNVSHDFRTPLTLISAPLETVVNDLEKQRTENTQQPTPNNHLPTPNNQQPTTNNHLHLLHIAQRNVRVLLDLINQILDFRKIENGKMTLNLQQADLGQHMHQWIEAFQQYGEQKGITITLVCDRTQDWNVMVDVKKLEGILYNLIGNAMKFTPRGGTITVTCRQSSNPSHLTPHTPHPTPHPSLLTISVADTGCGIDQEHIKNIFERFYQIHPTQHEGSGIGLALVQNLVTLMHGNIDITSNTDPSHTTGTTITLTIPTGEGKDNTTQTPPISYVMQRPSVTTYKDDIAVIDENETRQVVLIIDDNPDIISYIRTMLSDNYHVLTAADGQQGLKMAQQTIPDIILCDVMMPVMDGMECCRHLKTDMRTSHIPVIMLTACSLDEQRIQGLTEGAEAYISKPFSPAVLMAQIDTLLKNRKLLTGNGKEMLRHGKAEMADTTADHSHHTSSTTLHPTPSNHHPTPNSQLLTPYDREFLDKLHRHIADNIGNPQFNVEALAEAICLSRVQLYRKCKALTGSTPVEVLRNMRLEKGRDLLADGNTTIAAASKAVGFSDPAYFARCYKSYFGVAAKG